MKNLYILGAGGFGHVIKDMAEQSGKYKSIQFLDDNSNEAVGKISEVNIYNTSDSCFFVALGNNETRLCLINKLLAINSIIKDGCIINCGAVVDHNCIVNEGVHVCMNAVIKANNEIASLTKIEACCVVERG